MKKIIIAAAACLIVFSTTPVFSETTDKLESEDLMDLDYEEKPLFFIESIPVKKQEFSDWKQTDKVLKVFKEHLNEAKIGKLLTSEKIDCIQITDEDSSIGHDYTGKLSLNLAVTILKGKSIGRKIETMIKKMKEIKQAEAVLVDSRLSKKVKFLYTSFGDTRPDIHTMVVKIFAKNANTWFKEQNRVVPIWLGEGFVSADGELLVDVIKSRKENPIELEIALKYLSIYLPKEGLDF
jgi:hypothetical protein